MVKEPAQGTLSVHQLNVKEPAQSTLSVHQLNVKEPAQSTLSVHQLNVKEPSQITLSVRTSAEWSRTTGANVFCFLSSLPLLPPATTAVFGSYTCLLSTNTVSPVRACLII
jgi:hypothetical protein